MHFSNINAILHEMGNQTANYIFVKGYKKAVEKIIEIEGTFEPFPKM